MLGYGKRSAQPYLATKKHNVKSMVGLFVFSLIISWFASLLLIVNLRAHARVYSADSVQRFHKGHIPRLGGVAVTASSLMGWVAMSTFPSLGIYLNAFISLDAVCAFLLMLLPATLAGTYEDCTQRLSVRWRMVFAGLSAVLGCALLGLAVPRLGIGFVDATWSAYPLLGIALAWVALAGLPHAFNIIDGFNGLAGTVAIMICAALVHVALQLGDRQLAGVLVCVMGASAGFLFWNYPRSLIFAGDGGAYFWGLVIAASSISLVQRHSEVSPWFPMLLVIYPVWETLFSIYRKLVRGQSPGVADALHFHQLIYRRIVRQVFHDDASRRMLMRNNRTSPYLWGFTLLSVIPAVLFWRNTPVLMAFCGLFVVTYVLAYLSIIRFKVPLWLQR